jgi:FixJ family two-component response regulator
VTDAPAKDADPTIFVVDDDDAVRESLALLFRSVGLKAETFRSAAAFLAGHDPGRPGCLLLDVRMPGMSGPELQRALIAHGSVLPVIFISGHGDVEMAVQALQDGAVDFVQKPFRDQDLLDKVRSAIEIDARSRVDLARRTEIRERMDTLTARESEVMERVVEGSPNKAIAYDLGISERTVEVHRSRVMEKMKATSLPHLVRMFLVSRE